MQNEPSPSPRKRASSGASQGPQRKQPTQPKPLGAERDAARADLIAERAATPLDANAVLAHPGGAHSKRTPETVATILHCLELGMSYKKAATLAGITFETLNQWRKDDLSFLTMCQRSRVELERRMLEKLSAHTDSDLKAIMYVLERIVSPKKYGKKVRPVSMEMLVKQPDPGEPGKIYRVCFEAPKEMNTENVTDAE